MICILASMCTVQVQRMQHFLETAHSHPLFHVQHVGEQEACGKQAPTNRHSKPPPHLCCRPQLPRVQRHLATVLLSFLSQEALGHY